MIFNDHLITDLTEIAKMHGNVIFAGLPVDDRGEIVTKNLKNSGPSMYIELYFNPEKMLFVINEKEVGFRNFNSELGNLLKVMLDKNFTIDATTLSIAELLYIFRWIKGLNVDACVNILYAEPQNYTARIDTHSDFGKHQFSLSNDSRGYIGLPGFTKTAGARKKSHVIALLGFERVRLGQLLSIDEGAYIEGFTPIFGVPGFKPCYDKHSVYHNIELIHKSGEKPEFAAANNPFSTFHLLREISDSLPRKLLNIAPIGTKPMAIGACLFLIANDRKLGLMYDHPYKKNGRSEGVSKLHRYKVTFNK